MRIFFISICVCVAIEKWFQKLLTLKYKDIPNSHYWKLNFLYVLNLLFVKSVWNGKWDLPLLGVKLIPLFSPYKQNWIQMCILVSTYPQDTVTEFCQDFHTVFVFGFAKAHILPGHVFFFFFSLSLSSYLSWLSQTFQVSDIVLIDPVKLYPNSQPFFSFFCFDSAANVIYLL
jgi:hypothetical protein